MTKLDAVRLKDPLVPFRIPFPMPGVSPSRRSFAPAPRAERCGFTLLELLIVLMVLALFAATTVRWYFSHSDVTLENAAILLARDLRACQHRSIFLGERGRFVFLDDGEGYTVVDAAGEMAHNPQTEEPFLRIYPDDGVFKGVTVTNARAGSDRALEFDEQGRPLEDLSVTLAYHEDERTILLAQGSGVITIIGSTSGWFDFEQ